PAAPIAKVDRPVMAAPQAATPPPAAAAPPPAPPAAPPPPPEPPPARRLVEAVQQTVAQVSPCGRARSRWHVPATAARAPASALSRCLDPGSYDGRAERTALGAALATLDAGQDGLAADCP